MRFIFLALLIFSNMLYANEDLDRQKKLQVVNEQIEGLQTALAADNAQQEELQQALKALDIDIANSSTTLEKTQKQLTQTADTLKSLIKQHDEALQNLNAQQTALREQIRSTFIFGQFDTLKLLLNQTDPHATLRLLTYFDYFNTARTDIAKEIEKDMEVLSKTKVEQLVTAEKLEVLKAQQISAHAKLNEKKQTQSVLVKQLLTHIDEKNLALETLQADKQALERVIVDIQNQIPATAFTGNSAQPIRDHRGHLIWPVQGKVLHRFGEAFAGENTWQGILIAAPEGADVRSIYKGQVVYADWLRGFGLIIIVDHGEQYMSLYAHNQSLYKQAGDWVEVNEPIAVVGKSGPVANSGLYFEIRSKGEVQNPMTWLAPISS